MCSSDLVDDGDVGYTIETGAAASADSDYNLLPVADITVTNIDNNPTITTTTVADAENGASYNQALSATGGAGGYTWIVSVGALPSGLSISGSNIVGTPNATPGDFVFTLEVTDSGGQIDVQEITLTLNPSQ